MKTIAATMFVLAALIVITAQAAKPVSGPRIIRTDPVYISMALEPESEPELEPEPTIIEFTDPLVVEVPANASFVHMPVVEITVDRPVLATR